MNDGSSATWRRNYMRQKGYFMNIMKQYRERADIRVYLEILLSLLTISVFAIFALRPTLLTIAELLREIESKEEIVAKMDTKISNLTNAQILYDQNKNQINFLKIALPEYPQPDTLLRQFEGVSQSNGLSFTSVAFEEASLKGNPKLGSVKGRGSQKDSIPNSVPVTTNFTTDLSNYSAIASLINNFENFLLPLTIERLTLTKAQEDENEVLIVNLNGYFLYSGKETIK